MSGVIAAGHELTAQSGAEILRAGGNAFDAALAALATACVVEPALVSLGGGGFLLAQPEREAARLYDFFVQTPRGARRRSSISGSSSPISARRRRSSILARARSPRWHRAVCSRSPRPGNCRCAIFHWPCATRTRASG
jgi:gamma-glutamyltranspeptidase